MATRDGAGGAAAGNRRGRPRLPRQRVLVVEADDALRDLLVRALRAEGYGAVDAPDAAAARAAAAQLPPDAAIADARAARRWRGRRPPLVGTTGPDDPLGAAWARAAGAAVLLAKPFSRDELAAAVRAALASAGRG